MQSIDCFLDREFGHLPLVFLPLKKVLDLELLRDSDGESLTVGARNAASRSFAGDIQLERKLTAGAIGKIDLNLGAWVAQLLARRHLDRTGLEKFL